MKQGILWLPSGQDSTLFLLGDGMIPGREIRSYKPCGQKKKKKKQNKKQRERETSKTPWRQNQDDLDGETPKGRGYMCMCG